MERLMDDMAKLTLLRKQNTDLISRRTRIEGEVAVHMKQLEEGEQKCQEEFECSIEDLPDMIQSLKTEGAQALTQAEGLLTAK